MRVLAIRHHDIDTVGFIGEAFEARGASLAVHLFPDEGPLPALDGVDYVIVFGDPDVGRLLTLVKPDVHCKGTDYTVDSVPERAVVLSYGGRLAIVGDEKRHATRELLARIAETTDAAPGTKDQAPR